MTVDTVAIRAEAQKWGGNQALLTCDEAVALLDALDEERAAYEETVVQFEEYHTLATRLFEELDAERERVRVLTTTLTALRDRLPQFTLDDFCDWQREVIDAALAIVDAGGDGGTP